MHVRLAMEYVVLILFAIYICYLEALSVDDSQGILFYEELGCKAEPSIFPWGFTTYTCPKYNYGNGFCTSRGDKYTDGDIIRGTSRCSSCYCSASNDKHGKIICSRPKCSRFFVKKPCWEYHDLGECCPKKSFCPHKSMTQCKVDNEVYYEGQYIRPKGTCWECVCGKGFEISDKETCRKIRCDLEVYHYDKLVRKCLPLYKGSGKDQALCCPTNFICPDEITSITLLDSSLWVRLQSFSSYVLGQEASCSIGEESVWIGEKFKLKCQNNKYKNVVCTCKIPPFPLCVEE